MKFVKMHGLGNDFIMINDLQQEIKDYSGLALKLCDRHFGIGADGLIAILPSAEYDLKMRIFNADGSEPEMCGNGIRCFAKFVLDEGIINKEEMRIETLAGLRVPRIIKKDGKVKGIEVDMGEPTLSREKIPVSGEGSQAVNEEITIDGEAMRFTAVSMGNPHCVIFVDTLEGFPLERIGAKIETHLLFPRRTNVEFVQVVNERELKMRVWERGSGRTLACGTGACATGVAAVVNGKTGRKVLLHLDGGDLEIDWRESNNHVYMTGPAEKVFEGETTF